MKTVNAKWWTLKVPDDTCIAVCRDYAVIRYPVEPEIDVRLTVLRSEYADTTMEDLESYASSFYDGLRDRVPLQRNGWTGFVFTHVDPKSHEASCRGYFGKKCYVAILSMSGSYGGKVSQHNLIEELIGQLEVKTE